MNVLIVGKKSYLCGEITNNYEEIINDNGFGSTDTGCQCSREDHEVV